MHHADIILEIAIAIVAASVLALVARAARQPLILAYLAAGILVGPTEGLGYLKIEDIEPISEMGLILLLFMVGLEIDLKKLVGSGKPLIAAGIGQFVICVALGLAAAPWLGFSFTGGSLAPIYVAVAAALSSTMIVVKLLYDKFELDTIPGRITLGILVFQDVWAIVFLALQPNLRDPAAGILLLSAVKGIALVALALLVSRYILPSLFRWIARSPELMLIVALGWCFAVAAGASLLGLSREMGALIAGVSLSAFPYGLDVVAKIISLRDFFITLFFISLGAKIPGPTMELVLSAIALSVFLVLSRFLSITPILHALKQGNRVSFIPALNLSQISEFSLVICALGLSLGHIDQRAMSVIVYTLVITSVGSTYAIQYNHEIYLRLRPLMSKVGIRDLSDDEFSHPAHHEAKPIFFLGFSRYASSLLHELIDRHPEEAMRIGVVDFNPQVKSELDRRGIYNIYGDIAHRDTLDHANVQSAQVLVCTIPDSILKGTTNERMLTQLKALAPHAHIIVTADFFYTAKRLYQLGAGFVFVPRLMSIKELATVVRAALDGNIASARELENAEIERREQMEVLP
jgi:Kef-type K+ transport system membrane component KefB/Trk K+ transport system NAD-binding subunit